MNSPARVAGEPHLPGAKWIEDFQGRKVSVIEGKGAMVWQLRNWRGGDAQGQAQEARELGLDWVSLKIIDGRSETWENPRSVPLARQNAALLPGSVAALQEVGVRVVGWGYTYGGYYRGRVFYPSQRVAQEEGGAAIPLLTKYGMMEYQIDAEREYRRGVGKGERAEAHCLGLLGDRPVDLSLCSYRFPLSRIYDFPVRAFAPYVENWSPQVYWVRDHRLHAGAAQLQVTVAEYQSVRPLPMTPIGPTYDDRGWRATPAQLALFFEEANRLETCVGVGVWCLDQATPDQLSALADFRWRVPAASSDPSKSVLGEPGRGPWTSAEPSKTANGKAM